MNRSTPSGATKRGRHSVPMSLFRRDHQLVYARYQRRAPTASERALWLVLRDRARWGFRTKRQVVVGPYIADFVVPSARFVVEVDGSAHHGRELADAVRTRELEFLGYTVMRLTAYSVMRSPERAAARVVAEVRRILGTAADAA